MSDITAAKALALAADAVYLTERPPPISPTGYYDWQITVDPADDREGHSTVSNIINRVETLKAQGGYKPDPKHVVCTIQLLPSCVTQGELVFFLDSFAGCSSKSHGLGRSKGRGK